MTKTDTRDVDATVRQIEEATEASIAAREESDDRLASEISDLFFFALVSLAHRGVDPEKVWAELALRRR